MGGRHRAAVLASKVAAQMDHFDELRVRVVHRDLDEQLLPVGAGQATAWERLAGRRPAARAPRPADAAGPLASAVPATA